MKKNEKRTEFDKVIGYDAIKEELMQISDMISNRAAYEKLGARLPRGILLYGDPGMGKTLMAKCFLDACGLKSFTLRRNRSDDEFIDEITETFREAKKCAPCIVFLDDMDKFANEDEEHRDAEEYVAVQAGIDEVKDADVLVLATANDVRKLPRSLRRSGRFDRRIEVETPSGSDAARIILHYLSDKKLEEGVDLQDLTKMISYNSCAELETILNEAAIRAAYAGKDRIGMEELTEAVIRMQYDLAPEQDDGDDEAGAHSGSDRYAVALHEAGHVTVSEALMAGSVGFAAIRRSGGGYGGYTHRCAQDGNRRTAIMIALAGKAAVELYFADACASGCQSDISRAARGIFDGIYHSATRGFAGVDVSPFSTSESTRFRAEAVTQAELERYLFAARKILLENRAFLEGTAALLAEKKTLRYSDICALREQYGVKSSSAA